MNIHIPLIKSDRFKLRFWSKVRKTSACWVWEGGHNALNYGVVKVGRHCRLAQRVVWAMTFGRIPQNSLVLHKCDNPTCVNPQHLFIGSDADNLRDCMAKGRFKPNKGEKNGRAKLTDRVIKTIRKLRGSVTQVELASRFKVSQSLIWAIQSFRNWRHV